jgi:DNA-binding beta-propeller fold protein YncE
MHSLLLGLLLAAPPGDVVAGDGKAGYSGDGGPATAAQLNQPFHCELDGKGNLFIAEANNHCIRKVDLGSGTISTIAGTGKKGYTGDGGPATRATFNEPYAVGIDDEGNLYVADRLNAVIRRIDGKSGIISSIAGTGKKGYSGDGGPAAKAMLREPNDVCLDGKGGLLIADVADWRVRRVDLKTGVISTFAGTGPLRGRPTKEQLADGQPAAKALIVEARAVCVDGKGNTFICERRGNCIRRVDAKGVLSTIAGTRAKGKHDGPGAEATFNGPKAIRCDKAGNIYVVDTENHSVRRIEAGTWKVTTVATGMARPHGCVLAADGTLYIADSENNRVRRVRAGK